MPIVIIFSLSLSPTYTHTVTQTCGREDYGYTEMAKIQQFHIFIDIQQFPLLARKMKNRSYVLLKNKIYGIVDSHT